MPWTNDRKQVVIVVITAENTPSLDLHEIRYCSSLDAKHRGWSSSSGPLLHSQSNPNFSMPKMVLFDQQDRSVNCHSQQRREANSQVKNQALFGTSEETYLLFAISLPKSWANISCQFHAPSSDERKTNWASPSLKKWYYCQAIMNESI